jgi:hypothetical protein
MKAESKQERGQAKSKPKVIFADPFPVGARLAGRMGEPLRKQTGIHHSCNQHSSRRFGYPSTHASVTKAFGVIP